MSMKEILTKLDEMIAEEPAQPKTVEMTETQFLTYVKDEVTKAKAEKDKEKKKKRLGALRKLVASQVQKSSWEGGNGTAAIPVYTDPDQLQPTEESGMKMEGGGPTMADSSFAGAGGAQDFAKVIDDAIKGLENADVVPPAKDPPSETAKKEFEWPRDASNKDFMRGEVTKRGGDWGADPSAR